MELKLGTYRFVRQPNQHTRWYQRLWARIVWYTKVVLKLTTICGVTGAVIYLAFLAGKVSSPVHVTAQVAEQKVEAPVLDRIGGCESEGNRNAKPSQINPKTGQVRTHANSNGTTDIGAYQINLEVWGKKASELGYDLSQFEGNKAMAEWIYANKGTEDWYPSKACWK